MYSLLVDPNVIWRDYNGFDLKAVIKGVEVKVVKKSGYRTKAGRDYLIIFIVGDDKVLLYSQGSCPDGYNWADRALSVAHSNKSQRLSDEKSDRIEANIKKMGGKSDV